jgi:CxxC motif-containing protein
LAVLRTDEIEKVVYKQNGLEVIIDSTDKKVSLKNESTSLKDILQALADLLKQFKVQTPSGISTVVAPDSLNAILQFENSFKQLLK